MAAVTSVEGGITSWDDVEKAIENLPTDQREIAAGIVSARRVAATAATDIAEGPWRIRQATVQGHGGIGEPAVTLPLAPVPGLTIVTARNGTGKSSFVDGVRHALSNGEAKRVDIVDANVHFAARTVAVELTNGPRTIEIVDDGDGIRWREVGSDDGPVPAVWVAHFQRFLPVLLHSELSPFITNPGSLHDFLKQAIDLTVLDQLRAAVDEIKLAGNKAVRELDEPRRAALEALAGASFDTLAGKVKSAGAKPERATCTDLRRQAANLPSAVHRSVRMVEPWKIDAATIDAVLADAATLENARADAVSGMREVRDAIRALLDAEGDHTEELRAADRCPVCQTQHAGWIGKATAESERLDDLLAAVTAAEQQAGLQRLDTMLPPDLPVNLDETLHRLGGDTADDRITEWRALRTDASRLDATSVNVAAVSDVAKRSADLLAWYEPVCAAAEVEQRAEVAQQVKVGEAIIRWLDEVDRQRDTIDRGAAAERLATKVEGWIKTTRAAIFEPIGEEVRRIFDALNVDGPLTIGAPELTGGVRQAGKVAVRLEVEGTPVDLGSKNTSILSTGQRNALSLACYLPRASQLASPFGFLILDDPIHSFDGERVRFLAEELIRRAQSYQVVVLTHDDRLWRAVTALGARPMQVVMRRTVGKKSEVTIKIDKRPGDILLDELANDLKKESGARPLGTDEARVAMTLAICRQAVDSEVLTQLDILARYLQMTDDRFSRDQSNALTSRDQIDLLNRYAGEAGWPLLDHGRFTVTLDALNKAAHGELPEAVPGLERMTQCHQWFDDSRELIGLISSMGA